MKKSAITTAASSFFLSVAFFISNLFLPLRSFAQTTPDVKLHIKYDNPITSAKDLPGLLIAILDAAVTLLTPVVTIMLLYAGFLFVTAQGNAESLTKAKKTLMYTLIGAALVLGAKGFSLVIQSAIGCLGNAAGC